jgi:hypothetical protein
MTEDDKVVSLMRLMAGKDAIERPDGSWFGGHRDHQRLIEVEAAKLALRWLCENGHIASASQIITPDPPDVLATLTDGSKYGVEVTELVHGPTIAFIKQQRGLGDQCHYYTEWTDKLIQQEIQKRVSSKNKKPERYGHNPVALVIACDQPMITASQVENICVTSNVFAHVLVLFSYQPAASGVGEGTYPIVPLKIET